MKRELLAQLLRDREAKRAAVLVTELASGAQTLFHPDDPASAPRDAALLEAARAALASDRCQVVEGAQGRRFVQPFQAPARLLLVGAVHIAQPLARMAALVGFEVVVIDPRTAFASEERFPGIALSTAWPDAALRELGADARTAIVTLTHDPKLDDPALATALRSDCFYIASLGSRKTHAARLERLVKLGFGEQDLARIHGPAGLDIGARSPAEIAVAILAEVVQKLRARQP